MANKMCQIQNRVGADQRCIIGGGITSFFVSITLNRQKDKDKKRQKKT